MEEKEWFAKVAKIYKWNCKEKETHIVPEPHLQLSKLHPHSG